MVEESDGSDVDDQMTSLSSNSKGVGSGSGSGCLRSPRNRIAEEEENGVVSSFAIDVRKKEVFVMEGRSFTAVRLRSAS